MKSVEKLLAEKLLGICAIKLQPANPFVWASGWNSPIYTDKPPHPVVSRGAQLY